MFYLKRFLLKCLDCSVPAFINYNLEGDGLRHCIAVSKAKMTIYESTLAPQISAVSGKLQESFPEMQFISWVDNFSTTPTEKAEAIKGEFVLNTPGDLNKFSKKKIADSERKGITWQSPNCLIYTSGQSRTTELLLLTLIS